MVKKFILIFLLLLPVSLFSQSLDIRILRHIYSPQELPSDKIFMFISNKIDYFTVGIPVTIGTIGLIDHDDQLFRNACVTAAATILNLGVTTAMKYAINRPRPFITYPDIIKKGKGGSLSFPSGHTSNAFAIATSLSLAYPKWYIIVPTYTWASAVGYSRMYLGVHYPSDVLAGAVVGAGSAWLTYEVNKKLHKKPAKNHSRKPCNCPEF
jgi:membrane-associated phospholipid phosphatase